MEFGVVLIDPPCISAKEVMFLPLCDCEQNYSMLTTLWANSAHVLQSCLQDKPDSKYCLRERSHNKTLITKTADLSERYFFIRMIYRPKYSLLIMPPPP